jgi:hypothetical protein
MEIASLTSENGSELRLNPLKMAPLGDHSQRFRKLQASPITPDVTGSNCQIVIADQTLFEIVSSKAP